MKDRQRPLSEHIYEYYQNDDRFAEFLKYTDYYELLEQVQKFTYWFEKNSNTFGYGESKCEHNSTDTIGETATYEFCKYFRKQLKGFLCPP